MCSLCLQGSGDHPGPAVLWGHRHVVPGLCDSWALPGMAPLSGGLGVRSGNAQCSLGLSNCLGASTTVSWSCCAQLCSCTCECSLSASVCLRVCLGGWDASQIPLTAPDDSCAASLFIWTDATEPLVQLAQPLCSRARHRGVPLSLSVRRGSVGKPWASHAPSLNKPAWFFTKKNKKRSKVSHLQVSNQS